MNIKRSIALMTAVLVIWGYSGNIRIGADEQPPDETEKYEIVYAKLDYSGQPLHLYVINHFQGVGQQEITDYGSYDSLSNLSDIQTLTQSDDAVVFAGNDEDFYYQGNMKSDQLPWNFNVTYYLDGKSKPAEELAGTNGHLEIKFSSQANKAIDKTFYDNYMLQISLSLDSSKCTNIVAPEAMIAEAGKNKILTFTVLPGKDANYTILTDVKDFECSGIAITGVPFGLDIEMPDLQDSFGQLKALPDAFAQLNAGIEKLEKAGKQLAGGFTELETGSQTINNGLQLLSGNSAMLMAGSSQIKDSLEAIVALLQSGSLADIDLSQLALLPTGLTQLADGLAEISGNLQLLNSGFQANYGALDSAIGTISPGTLTGPQLAEFLAGLDSEQQLVAGQLIADYQAAQTVKTTYGAVKPSFEAVSTTLDTVTANLDNMEAGLRSMISDLENALGDPTILDQLGGLVGQLGSFSSQYAAFHSGLAEYTTAVDSLALNYSSFHSGLQQFNEGISKLTTGLTQLAGGSKTMADELADLPRLLKQEINKLKKQYLAADFKAISFTSPKNKMTVYVQFVIQTAEIKKPEVVKEAVLPSKADSLWQRIIGLFGGNKQK